MFQLINYLRLCAS